MGREEVKEVIGAEGVGGGSSSAGRGGQVRDVTRGEGLSLSSTGSRGWRS